MKTIDYTNLEFSGVLEEIADTGEAVCISLESGAEVVAIEKSQYEILLNALRMVFAASASVNADSQTVSISDTLNKFDVLSQ